MRVIDKIYETRIDVPYRSDLQFIDDGSLILENQLFVNSHSAYEYLDKDHGNEIYKLENAEQDRLIEEYPIEIYADEESDECIKEVIDYSVDKLNDGQIAQFLKDYPQFELKTSTITIDDKTFEKKVFVEKEGV